MVTLNEEIIVGVRDDDESVIEHLRAEIDRRPGVTLVEPASNGDHVDGRLSPDLLLVDPLGGGEEPRRVLGRFAANPWPLLLVVTSDRALATHSFEQGVLDFILKPVEPQRLSLALERGIEGVRAHRRGLVLRSLLSSDANGGHGGQSGDGSGSQQPRFPGRLLIREQGRVFVVDTDRIKFIRADGNYLRIYEEGREHLARGTMDEVLECLDRSRFVRIHRSTIVNIQRVREFVPDMKGRYLVRMEGGAELVLSRSYRDHVLKRAL